jgi:hypothetical protein
MVLEFVLGFVVLVAASYVGTTMALRGFFGRNYYDQSAALAPDWDDTKRESPENGGFENEGSEGESSESGSFEDEE